MTFKPKTVQSTYLTLTLFSTLAASFIWGINTLFLLDAGLTNAQAFATNAFFTAGQVIFEIPTGIVADTWGRRTSYLMGTVSLALATLAYLFAWQAGSPFWVWAVISAFLGLGFTFFSGATEAWLVDALAFTKFKGSLESVFGKGQMVAGAAMLSGSVAGGLTAQATNLGVPYLLRAGFLFLTMVVAAIYMKDLGFTPKRTGRAVKDMQNTFKASLKYGLKNRPVRWLMIAAPFASGVGFYTFYALQPHLLNLYGDQQAYAVAGLAAAIVAGAQIMGGFLAGQVKRLFTLRTTVLLSGTAVSAIFLFALGFTNSFWLAIFFLVIWALMFAALMPVRQTYLNGLIPSNQRATVLSFDSLMGSSGGVVIQPALGKVADNFNYPLSFMSGAGIQLLSLPFILLARREKPQSDKIS
jgi:MFS family permease